MIDEYMYEIPKLAAGDDRQLPALSKYGAKNQIAGGR